MKVEVKDEFRPVAIILETREELAAVREIINKFILDADAGFVNMCALEMSSRLHDELD